MAAVDSAAHGVRTAYPYLTAPRAGRVRWACLLDCGHTVELELLPGTRPRRTQCPSCAALERPAAGRDGAPLRAVAPPVRSPGRPAVEAAARAAESRQLGFWFDLEA